jgi:16S rRNA (guanine966-N2)-methyltransferase
VRVIGGRWRGRTLRAPSVPGLRPTSDRVREAIFDVLGSRGGVEGLTVVDLFAGSGALGIEALSRGARHATFVERNGRTADAIVQNLAVVGARRASWSATAPDETDDEAPPTADVVRSDALGFLRSSIVPYDLAFCDPPYDFEGWLELTEVLGASTAVLESRRPVEVSARFEVARVYRYGGTLVTLAERRRSAAAKGFA